MAVVFDTTIVSVALDELGTDLHAPISTIQWVSTGYLLAMFMPIPVAGWAQTVLGAKRLWIAALGVFLLGSLLCACAWDAPSLIAGRVVQGIGGGGLRAACVEEGVEPGPTGDQLAELRELKLRTRPAPSAALSPALQRRRTLVGRGPIPARAASTTAST
jgi:hypothetical protein